MQYQICPRCKFRAPANKTICTTCGQSFNSVRKPVVENNSKIQANSHSQQNSLRTKISENNSHSGGSFWRTFFGLEPVSNDKTELGET